MPSNNNIYKMSNAGGMSTITRYTDMLAGNAVWNPWEPAGAYEPIGVGTVGAIPVASVTFGSIPQTYAHLQIRYISRGAVALAGVMITINSDTGTNYSSHSVGGNGSITFAGGGATQSNPLLGYQTPSSSGSNGFGAGIADILDYANTNKYKTVRTFSGTDDNGGTGYLSLLSDLWQSTSAITSINLNAQFGSNFAQYSTFALYGIKG